MNVSIGPRWEKFIEEAVQDGGDGSASDVVREGLRLVQEREAKLSALRRRCSGLSKEAEMLARRRSTLRWKRQPKNCAKRAIDWPGCDISTAHKTT